MSEESGRGYLAEGQADRDTTRARRGVRRASISRTRPRKQGTTAYKGVLWGQTVCRAESAGSSFSCVPLHLVTVSVQRRKKEGAACYKPRRCLHKGNEQLTMDVQDDTVSNHLLARVVLDTA